MAKKGFLQLWILLVVCSALTVVLGARQRFYFTGDDVKKTTREMLKFPDDTIDTAKKDAIISSSNVGFEYLDDDIVCPEKGCNIQGKCDRNPCKCTTELLLHFDGIEPYCTALFSSPGNTLTEEIKASGDSLSEEINYNSGDSLLDLDINDTSASDSLSEEINDTGDSLSEETKTDTSAGDSSDQSGEV